MKTPPITGRCASGICGLLALLLTAAAPAANVTLIATNSAVKVLVPTNGALDSVWYTASYVPGGNWISGTTGVGYDGAGGSYLPMIGTDIKAQINGINGSFYMRQSFVLTTTAGISTLTLRMKYDDGFAAFLNGTQVTAANAPATPVWNSLATAAYEADAFVDFNISTSIGLLQSGTNILAIQGLNKTRSSSDLLILPELIAVITQTFFQVSSTLPANGAQLSASPAQITVNFGAAVNTNTLSAADLRVDGNAATNFTVIDSDSVQFGLPSGLSKGLHSITLGEGSIQSTGGALLTAYAGAFSIIILPTVQNLAATDIGADQAILRARLTDTGGDATEVMFAWGLSDGGVNANAWGALVGSGTATTNEFFAELNGLSAATTYYYRTLGINRAGTNWAPSTATFSTKPVTLPAIYRLWATDISLAGAKLNGELANTGGEAPEVHIVWGNENSGTNAAAWDHDVRPGTWDETAFSVSISGLTANTTYYFAAYASNSAGRVWKAAEQFTTPGTDLIITEFMADNSTVLADGYGAYSDWIEIHNPAGSAQNLTGWYLTDNASNLKKWKFPSATLGGGQYLIVFASGRNTNEPSGRLHTSFSLSAGGEYLALVKPDGTTIVSEYTFPGQYSDISCGLSPDGTQIRYFNIPTPGATNNIDYWDLVADTKFSVDRGFYTNAFTVTITTATANATLRYTRDGSWPTETHGTIYSNAIAISNTTVLRAFGYKADFESSDVDAQTYIFINDIVRQPSNPPGWPATFVYQNAGSWYTVTANWGVYASQIAKYEPQFRAALTNSLTISLSSDMDMLLLATNTSLFAQPKPTIPMDHPVSVEIFDAAGGKSIQLNAAIRMMGAASGLPSKTKPNLRLLFKSEFTDPTTGRTFRGPSKLDYPVFPDTDVESFNTLVLRGMIQNGLVNGTGVCIRDAYTHRRMQDMGYTSTHYRFVHVYINGLYFGVFQAQERPDDAYMESYYGGDRTDYDVWGPDLVSGGKDSWNGTKAVITSNPYVVVPVSNTTARCYLVSVSNYTKLKNQYVEMERYADYMLMEKMIANTDWPTINFYLNCRRGSPSNGPPAMKWIPITWDADYSMNVRDVNLDFYNLFTVDASRDLSLPGIIWNGLYEIPAWKRFFSDRVQKLMFNGGELTTERMNERWASVRDELSPLVAGEICKWSPASIEQWSNNVNVFTNNFWPVRYSNSLVHLRAHGFLPPLDAPGYSPHGGVVPQGYALSITNPNASGAIWYTLNDADPRDTVSILYTGTPVTIRQTVRVKACVSNELGWSALNEAVFQVVPEIEVTELMYNPPGGGGYDAQEYEFIEVCNVGSGALDLSPIRFTNGISMVVGSSITNLAPGGYAVFVRNLTAFTARYGTNGIRIAGSYSNSSLDNAGERLSLSERQAQPVLSFKYNDKWYPSTDGGGYSLVKNDPAPSGDPGTSNYWRASPDYFGSPGARDSDAAVVPVQITEVLTHTDWPQTDAIELYNPTNSTVNLGGWWLTDNLGVPKKFQIPTNTLIQPYSYLVIYEDNDANTNNVPPPAYFGGAFSLSSHGEEVYLSSPTLHWMHGFKFGAAANGGSFGRYVTSGGQENFPPQKALTLGGTNAGPLIGPVVITEIMYYPPPGRPEYLELRNSSTSSVALYDPANRSNTWGFIEGITCTFPTGLVLLPGQYLLLTDTNEAAFRAAWGPPDDVRVIGSYTGRLDNAGERLVLARPDNPNADGSVPMLATETVSYKSSSFWPVGADGTGAAFERITDSAFSDDPDNWRISNISGSPGDSSQVDADDDQLPDNWETTHFGQTDHAQGGPDQDADGDGISNFREYILGTNPRAVNAEFLGRIATRNSSIEIQFDSILAGQSGYYGLQRVYGVQQRIPSATSIWEALPGQMLIPATGAPITVTNIPDWPAGWYRIRATLE